MLFLKSFKKYVIGIVIGLLVGLWQGVNIGKDQPWYSNPFDTETLTEKAKRKADDIISDTKKNLREKLKDEADEKIK